MSWKRTLGRASFINCDPIFYSLENRWNLLTAPPSWLTGHLLRRDCLIAPIPSADYASNSDLLQLVPDIGIVSEGKVGSVIVFGNRSLDSMRDIAVPTDSSTSKILLKWLLNKMNLDPRFIEMPPDLDSMLSKCDGALLIGDRALISASSRPEMTQLDLGYEWTRMTGLPMVFGVFAARKDSPLIEINIARKDLIEQYESFKNIDERRASVIRQSAETVDFPINRISAYFDDEVSNILDKSSINGLTKFLGEVCGMNEVPTWSH